MTLDPVTVAKVTPSAAHFGVAESLLPGVLALADAKVPAPMALALVASHSLECLLKAFLLKAGRTEKDLKEPNLRHNLEELWRQCVLHGLDLASPPPAWVGGLSALHNAPFHLRYNPKRFNGLVLPGAEPMSTDLQGLLKVVRDAIR